MDLSSLEPQTAESLFTRLSTAIKQATAEEDLQAIQAIFKIVGEYRPSKDPRKPSPEMAALNQLRAKGYITKMHLVRDKLNRNRQSLGMYRTEMKKVTFNYGSVPLYETWLSDLEVRTNLKQKILRFIWENKDLSSSYQSIWSGVESKWGLPIMEGLDKSHIKQLLISAFPQAEISALHPGMRIDVVEVEQQIDGIIKISVVKNKSVAGVDIKHRLVKTTDGYVYLADWHTKERAISTHFIVDPQNEVAEQGLTYIELKCDHINGGRTFEGWTIDFPKEGFMTRLNKKVEESSGYIPSESEKNDPRWKTALTKDVRPDTMQKSAKKFGWKIKRDGTPPTMG